MSMGRAPGVPAAGWRHVRGAPPSCAGAVENGPWSSDAPVPAVADAPALAACMRPGKWSAPAQEGLGQQAAADAGGWRRLPALLELR
eukprot:scaffold543_cov312-Prasinococcus_capsulatus_cf.AAC.4